jgi:hypothetical protein
MMDAYFAVAYFTLVGRAGGGADMALAKQPTLPAGWKREVNQLGALPQCANASRFCNKVWQH